MKITAQEFDEKFDNYEDIDEFLGLTFEDTIKVLLARELQVI